METVTSNRYSSFMFLRLDGKFRHLMSNERIAAKQEFENLVGACQEKVFLRTYSLVGIKAGYDMLMWIISHDIDALQKTWGALSNAGIGKYLSAEKSFLGVYPLPETPDAKELAMAGVFKNPFGKFKYMLLHPLSRTHSWHEMTEEERRKFTDEREAVLKKHPDVIEHFFYSYGLDDQEYIVVRESDNMEELAATCKQLREQRIKMFTKKDSPALFCVGRDLREILDTLG
ncbi:MAG: chlorite dismutase family protein [Elusimicrobia bacterium]|nr:chlorite dismutase family protein [Elusimicrobiota bacterium]